MSKNTTWIIIALITTIISAPHATVIRVMVDSTDPFYWVFVRVLPVVVFLLPWFLIGAKKIAS